MLWPALSCNPLLRDISYTAGCRGHTAPSYLLHVAHKIYPYAVHACPLLPGNNIIYGGLWRPYNPLLYHAAHRNIHSCVVACPLLQQCDAAQRQCVWRYMTVRAAVSGCAAAVRQCSTIRQCVCGSAAVCSSAVVCGSARSCVRQRAWQCVAVCGIVW
jgi:hypothetical protein